jgi:diacylglycerol kinase family enzyme
MSDRRSFAAVVNPAAGAGAAATTVIRLARELREAGAEVRVAYSRSLGHATDLAAAAAGSADAVLAVGGDGLAGAVAAALAGTGTAMAVVPAGRGNDLARALAPVTAAGLLGAPSRAIDVAEANGRIVLGSVYAGLDAAANDAANRRRLPRRPIAYRVAAAGVLTTWRPVDYELLVDGEPERLRGHTVVVANAPWYGGGLRVAPAARLDDGRLHLITVADLPRRRIVGVLAAMRHGAHTGLPGITARPIREITLRTARPTPVYADGEPLSDTGNGVTIRVRPAALHLLGT